MVYVRSDLDHKFFLPNFLSLDHSFERSFSATYFSLLGAFGVVVVVPLIEIGLQLPNCFALTNPPDWSGTMLVHGDPFLQRDDRFEGRWPLAQGATTTDRVVMLTP